MSYPLGSHLVTERFGYTHHGIYVGNDTVVHYLNEEGITTASLEEFSLGHNVWVRSHCNARYSGEECAERAWSRVGEDNYNLVFNNCEHFANWCATGEARSEQVENAVKIVSDTIKPKTGRPDDEGKHQRGDTRPTTIPTTIGGIGSAWLLDQYLSNRNRDDDDGDFLDRADKVTDRFFEKAGDIGEDAVNKVADAFDAVKSFFKG